MFSVLNSARIYNDKLTRTLIILSYAKLVPTIKAGENENAQIYKPSLTRIFCGVIQNARME